MLGFRHARYGHYLTLKEPARAQTIVSRGDGPKVIVAIEGLPSAVPGSGAGGPGAADLCALMVSYVPWYFSKKVDKGSLSGGRSG